MTRAAIFYFTRQLNCGCVCVCVCMQCPKMLIRIIFHRSIRQYELKEHTDINMNKVYTGEIGRLKSFEVQKP